MAGRISGTTKAALCSSTPANRRTSISTISYKDLDQKIAFGNIEQGYTADHYQVAPVHDEPERSREPDEITFLIEPLLMAVPRAAHAHAAGSTPQKSAPPRSFDRSPAIPPRPHELLTL